MKEHSNSRIDEFRPDLLALRRRMNGISQTELAERTGISQGTLSKWEQGLRPVTEEGIEKLAQSLNCPVSFFCQSERVYGAPISAHPMYRKKASTGQKVLDQLIAELNVRISHLRTLLESVDLRPELQLPHYDPDDYQGEIAQIAANIRRAWYVPSGPIPDLTEYAERAGCIVVHCEMGDAKLDGVSYQVPGLPPMIFLNRDQSADRMRFTLAHEIGHLVMHPYPTLHMEDEANQFASALLMPESDIGAELRGLTIEKAAYMKPYWRVSMAALIYRARTLNRIDQSKYEYMWRQMSFKGFRTREPESLDFPKERPSVMPALLENMTKNMGYSLEELAAILHLHLKEVVRMYSLTAQNRPSLHVIK